MRKARPQRVVYKPGRRTEKGTNGTEAAGDTQCSTFCARWGQHNPAGETRAVSAKVRLHGPLQTDARGRKKAVGATGSVCVAAQAVPRQAYINTSKLMKAEKNL